MAHSHVELVWLAIPETASLAQILMNAKRWMVDATPWAVAQIHLVLEIVEHALPVTLAQASVDALILTNAWPIMVVAETSPSVPTLLVLAPALTAVTASTPMDWFAWTSTSASSAMETVPPTQWWSAPTLQAPALVLHAPPALLARVLAIALTLMNAKPITARVIHAQIAQTPLEIAHAVLVQAASRERATRLALTLMNALLATAVVISTKDASTLWAPAHALHARLAIQMSPVFAWMLTSA
jgi:hypothetical protein